LNWSKYPLTGIVNYAIELCSTGNFFEIVNESFFERLCEFFKTEYDRLKEQAETTKSTRRNSEDKIQPPRTVYEPRATQTKR